MNVMKIGTMNSQPKENKVPRQGFSFQSLVYPSMMLMLLELFLNNTYQTLLKYFFFPLLDY